MSDPFKIDGPTCLSVSGGRTSMYMLWRVLEANNGLPKDSRALFCNTGKEEEATLRFVQRCSQEWGVPITWLEYQQDEVSEGAAEFAYAIAGVELEKRWRVVTCDTASRDGKPFEAVIAQRAQFTGPLPNPRSRYCSSELKTRTMQRYLRAQGWDEWDTLIGIRADEPRRVVKFRNNPNPEGKHETVRVPLADIGVTAHDVADFWRAQSFDLKLPNNNGKTMHGNCDLCFLKPTAQIASLIAEKPERAVWWAKQEEIAAKRLPPLMEPIYELEELSDEEYTAAIATYKARIEAGEFDEWEDSEVEMAEPARQIRRQKIGLDGKPMFRQRPNTGALFRVDRPSYSEMAKFAFAQRDAFDPNEEAIACFCGD